jgi:hypothetical protein
MVLSNIVDSLFRMALNQFGLTTALVLEVDLAAEPLTDLAISVA